MPNKVPIILKQLLDDCSLAKAEFAELLCTLSKLESEDQLAFVEAFQKWEEQADKEIAWEMIEYDKECD